MDITPDTRLALDPEFCLKNDIDRAVLITRPQPLSKNKPQLSRLLHPKEAIILALMDGDRTVGELMVLWAELMNLNLEDASARVDAVLQQYVSGNFSKYGFLIEVNDANRKVIHRYEAMDFVIPARQVNLKDPRLRRPYTVYYLPTLFCPQKCVYCYAKTCPRPEEELISLPRLRDIFMELSELGVEVIQLSGGDPFARKDIFSIIEAVFQAGMVPDLPTKLGMSRNDAKRLKDIGVDLVQVSLDSADPEILDRMVGVRGYHSRVFQVLEDLRLAGLHVRVNTVLTPLNVPTIGQLIEYLGNLGNVVRVALTPYGRSLFCHRDELFLSIEERARVEEEKRAKAPLFPHMTIAISGGAQAEPKSAEGKRQRFDARAFCTANRHGFIILPDGRVTVCEELYDHPSFIIGDLRRQSVMEMWNSPEALALLYPDQSAVPEGPCRTCPIFAQCNLSPGRCWRDVIKSYGWNKTYYPDPRCPLAPPGNRLN